MDVERLSPVNRDLLRQALPEGQLVNVLYREGSRDQSGFDRERRCFALGERGWLSFLGWEGRPMDGAHCVSRWSADAGGAELARAGVAAHHKPDPHCHGRQGRP